MSAGDKPSEQCDTRILKQIKGQNRDLEIILSKKFLEYRNEARIYQRVFY